MKQNLLAILFLVLNISAWCQSKQTVIDFNLKSKLNTNLDFNTQEGNMKAAPNPFSDYILIKGVENEYDVKVFDILGNEVYNFISLDESIGLATNTYPSGIYLIELSPLNNDALEKVVFKMIKL